MNRKTKPLETNRLLLCEIKEEDTPLIVQWRSQPEVYQYFLSPKPLTEEEHINWYRNCYLKDNKRIDFMAVEKDTGKQTGLFNIKRDEKKEKYAEIGYLLEKSSQGKGYAKEGIEKLMTFSREDWKCEKIIFHIHEKNTVSRTLAKKLGYTECRKEGNFVIYHISLSDNSWGDRVKVNPLDASVDQVAA